MERQLTQYDQNISSENQSSLRGLCFLLLHLFCQLLEPAMHCNGKEPDQYLSDKLCHTLIRGIGQCYRWTGKNSQSSTSRALAWIQRKLGKQYLVNKFTLPWQSSPGLTPIRGGLVILVASVGLKKMCPLAIVSK